MTKDILLPMMVILPFIGSFIISFMPRHDRNSTYLLAFIIALSSLACAILLLPQVADGGVVRYGIEWIPSIGMNLTFRMDGLAFAFSALVLGIGLLIILYAHYYMSPKDPVPRFFSYLLGFMGAMIGVVLSGNLIQLVIFWELTSIFSFLLIGYWHHNANARDGARMALIVTAAGGLCLLVGVLMLRHITGSFDLDVVLASGDLIRAHPLYEATLILILLAAFTKSAQFPFFFWLPRAMAAPTPVSAYLHSATMVKVGIFLLIRLWPVLSGTEIWVILVANAGLITMLLGAYLAIFQHDLKGLLAYSTISHLGLITLLLGLGSPHALVAAIFHTLNHATFKASLFMAAGIIDHETGTRDMRKLSGLYRVMPQTARLAMVAAAAMAGVPLLNGFISKEMFFAETIEYTGITEFGGFILPFFATLAGSFAVLYSLRFIDQTFFGPPMKEQEGKEHSPHDPVRWMRLPIELLVLACLIVGIFPEKTIGPFLKIAVDSVLHEDAPYYSLAVWHGFNYALMMSIVAMCAGIIMYLLFKYKIDKNVKGAPLIYRVKGWQMFEASLALTTIIAQWIERQLGTRRLQVQLRLIMATVLLAGFFIVAGRGIGMMNADFFLRGSPPDPAFIILWIIGCACAIGATIQVKYHRFVALILIGGAGLVSCLTFAWFSAPDLAITQLLVEIVATVLLILGLRWLPQRKTKTMTSMRLLRMVLRRGTDITLSVCAGLGMALLSYTVMVSSKQNHDVSDYYLTNAYIEAGGRNVVNVLLVDFRAFDTLGEITVLGIVGMTVFALLRRFRPAAESLAQPDQQRIQNAYDDKRTDREVGATLHDYLLVPRLVIQWFFPVIIVLAIWLFLRGHDNPGGGFAAGIAMTIAFVLLYIAFGVRWVETKLTVLPLYWIGTGLMIATLTGIGSWIFGFPFLSSYFAYLDTQSLGKIPMASALLFDLGVFILVVGASTLMLIAIAHQSIRKPRVIQASAAEEDAMDSDAAPAPAPEPEPEQLASEDGDAAETAESDQLKSEKTPQKEGES